MLEQLNAGLQTFVERELKSTDKDKWIDAASELSELAADGQAGITELI